MSKNQHMKKIVIILFLSLSYIIIQAQRIIEVKYTEDMQGNYNFTCTNNAFCKYILQVDFTTLDNTKSDRALPFRGEVSPGINKLFRLSKENANNPGTGSRPADRGQNFSEGRRE